MSTSFKIAPWPDKTNGLHGNKVAKYNWDGFIDCWTFFSQFELNAFEPQYEIGTDTLLWNVIWKTTSINNKDIYV